MSGVSLEAGVRGGSGPSRSCSMVVQSSIREAPSVTVAQSLDVQQNA